MATEVRVRFAPSPTGGLHLGGVRTVLYNYLFAKQHGGKFVLRIEDTDQSRFVEGAEAYIIDCLRWCGLEADEGPHIGGPFGPYRQSERKELYRGYAEQLVREGKAYYAFDTPEELERMREEHRSEQNPSPQYDHKLRMQMRNSLSLAQEEVNGLLQKGTPYVIRIRMPVDEVIGFEDLIRGPVNFNTSQVDDKVLLKADGMPTYHLAVVIDDYLMKISHAFRGEEWLPSAPVHILLWKYLGLELHRPQYAHLPLILKPEGNGKLSKRDGDRLGFPVFAMDWKDPNSEEVARGFKEMGFLPQAFINMLAMLGWNDGTGKELFTLPELIQAFSLERVHKGGARFDFEKAKWFNHEWLKHTPAADLEPEVKAVFDAQGIDTTGFHLTPIIALLQDRCHVLPDFVTQGRFFFKDPETYDLASIQSKWDERKFEFFRQLVERYRTQDPWNVQEIEALTKQAIETSGIKSGEILQPLRIMLVGGKFGPAVFEIAALLGPETVTRRIEQVLGLLVNK